MWIPSKYTYVKVLSDYQDWMDFCYLRKKFWIFIIQLWDSGRVIPKNFSKKKVNTYNQEEEAKK